MAVCNRLEYTLDCLDSFSKQSYKDIEITIYDSGSTDGTYETILQKYPGIKIIKGTIDVWDAPGLVICIDYVKSIAKVGDYILIQNQDATMDKDFVATLLSASEKYNRAVVGSINKSKKTNEVIYHVPILKKGLFKPSILNGTIPKVIENVPTLPTRGTILPIEVFNKIGNYSKIFPHYAADYDLTCRAKRAGFKLLVATDAISYSQDDNRNMAWKIKHKDKKSFKDFINLFTHIKSSANLYYMSVFVLLDIPFPQKILGIIRVWLYPFKFFFVDYLYKSVIKK
ncbi:glycosyltransferase [Candidatus Dojkabacteria bacterium]|nr:glycosyltransferase [Candidatus Dojkabacteria bacterium]